MWRRRKEGNRPFLDTNSSQVSQKVKIDDLSFCVNRRKNCVFFFDKVSNRIFTHPNCEREKRTEKKIEAITLKRNTSQRELNFTSF